MKIDTADMVSVSEASNRGVSKLVAEAEAGREWVILRGNKPAAAMIGVSRLQRLRELEERESGMGLIATAITRMLIELERAKDVDEIQKTLGISDDELVEPVAS